MYCGAAYTNETSRVYDIFMNFCVVPREMREIYKRGEGAQNKLRGGGGGVQKSRKNICSPPIYFEPESTCTIIYIHTYIHTCIHTYMYTYIHAYTVHLIQKGCLLNCCIVHCVLLHTQTTKHHRCNNFLNGIADTYYEIATFVY